VTADFPVSDVRFGIAKLGETRFKSFDPKAGTFDEQIRDWRRVLVALAADFRAGQAVVDPKEPGKTCRFCGLHPLCRIREARASDGPEPETAHA
jgi:hypothetical protein